MGGFPLWKLSGYPWDVGRSLSGGGYCKNSCSQVVLQIGGMTVKMKKSGGFQKESACPETLKVQSKSFLLGEPHCGMLPSGKRSNYFLICSSTYLVLACQHTSEEIG